jgi:signal transduction histidine kinase
MKCAQTAGQQSDKAKGAGDAGGASARVDVASEVHALGRVGSGFDLMEVVSEYRALRASVLRLWRESIPAPDTRDLDDVTRFNEGIDQSLTEAVRSYTERIDRSRQTFLAILGHDLRGPLHSVMMSAQLLSRTGRVDAGSHAEASQIMASATAMAQMIGDLLDFTACGLGAAMPLEPAPTDLGELCREVVEETRSGHPTRRVRVEASGDLAGEWDAARLRQVISNLLGNAVQHGADPIDLSVHGEGPQVLLAVRSVGTPIPPDVLGTIFDPLVRGSSPDLAQRRRPGSIGLGLFIAREVVTGHGGDIRVESSAEAGTVFTVRLPRRRPSTKQRG